MLICDQRVILIYDNLTNDNGEGSVEATKHWDFMRKKSGNFRWVLDVYRLSRLRQESSGSRAVGRGDPEVCATQFAHSFRVRNAQICTYAHIQRDTRTCIYNSHTHIYILQTYTQKHTHTDIHTYIHMHTISTIIR